MTTQNTAANTVNVSGQVEVVTVSSAMKKMKKTALIGTALASLGIAAFYGYQLYKKGKVVVEVVAEPAAEETATETAAPAEAA